MVFCRCLAPRGRMEWFDVDASIRLAQSTTLSSSLSDR